MQVVNTPYTSIKSEANNPTGWHTPGLNNNSLAYISQLNNTLPVNLTVVTGLAGLNTISISSQPFNIFVGGVIYQQVADNPQPTQFIYNANKKEIVINISPLHNNHNIVIAGNPSIGTTPSLNTSLSLFGYPTTHLFDRVPISELGSDFHQFLVDIQAGHSSELVLSYSHSKGELPTASLEIEVIDSELDGVLTILESSISSHRIHFIYGTPFYLKPFSITKDENTNVSQIALTFDSVYAPRSEYNKLDWYIYVNKSSNQSFGSIASGKGIAINGAKSVIKTKRKDDRERKQVRSILQSLANANSSFIDYSKQSIELINNLMTKRYFLPDNFSILPEYTITRNGVMGAPLVDGVRLSSPWIYKGWSSDDSDTVIDEPENINNDTEDNDLKMVESRLIGEPDLEPSTPTKILDGANYQYRSQEEIDNFSKSSQNPSSIAYPNGFKKSRWTQKNEYGFNAGQLNGQEWGWQIVSTDVWSYYDEPVPNPAYQNNPSKPQFLFFQKDPIWIYTPPVYEAHWKLCRSWSTQVEFDSNGYPTSEQEIGTKWIQPKTEGDNRTAAQLLYDADKLEYEADVLRSENKINEANEKDRQAVDKRKDADLYKFTSYPYTRTTKRFYRRLALDRPEIDDDQNTVPCNEDERNADEPTNPPAYFLERELVEENSLFTIPSPYAGESPITIGESYESRFWVIVSPGGFQTFESTRSSNQQGGETSNLSAGEYRTGTPDPAPYRPKITRDRWERDKKKPDKKKTRQSTIYLNTPGGDTVSYHSASRSSISIEGVRDFGAALPALLNMYREENLASEQTVTDSPWHRKIRPGDRAFWRGKSWQCTSISRRDRFVDGLIQCQSYQCDWGSFIEGLTLNTTSISSCEP